MDLPASNKYHLHVAHLVDVAVVPLEPLLCGCVCRTVPASVHLSWSALTHAHVLLLLLLLWLLGARLLLLLLLLLVATWVAAAVAAATYRPVNDFAAPL